tara:strand:- start:1496 stop:2122 length:627 start_codon:yes stop_codon:yes gene_type:complete
MSLIRLGKILKGVKTQKQANTAIKNFMKGKNVSTENFKKSLGNIVDTNKQKFANSFLKNNLKMFSKPTEKAAATTTKGTGAGSGKIRQATRITGIGKGIKAAFEAGKTTPRQVLDFLKNAGIKVDKDKVSAFIGRAADPKKKSVAEGMLKIAPAPSGKKAVGQTIKQEKLKGKAQGGLINRRYGGMIGNKSSGHNGNDIVAAGYTKIA